jgi:hypothetical protein
MAARRISHADGSTTIQMDATPTDKLSAAPPTAPRIRQSGIRKRSRDGTFSTGTVGRRMIYGIERDRRREIRLPRALHSGLRLSVRSFWKHERVREWSEPQILAWEDSIRTLATRLPKKRD